MMYVDTLNAIYRRVSTRLREKNIQSHGIDILSERALHSLALASAGNHLGDDREIHRLTSVELCYSLYWRNLRRIPDKGALAGWSQTLFTYEDILHRDQALSNSLEGKLHGRRAFQGAFSEVYDAGERSVYVDVSNTIDTKAWTGIQRVVRNLCKSLREVRDINLCYYDKERNNYVRISDLSFKADTQRDTNDVVIFKRGDVFFDIDGSWGDSLSRPILYAQLKRQGILIFAVHYDAVPVLFPEFSHPTTVLRYAEHLSAVINYADEVFCISDAVRKDLNKLCAELHLRMPATHIIEMGYEFHSRSTAVDARAQKIIDRGPYILCVGTIEPRKNYGLILSNIDNISKLGYRVVIIGKRGWESDAFFQLLEDKVENSSYLTWLHDANDQTLESLYLNAEALVVPSFYEGFGLPVLEGLARGCRVLVSDGGALPEALDNGNGYVFKLNEEEFLPALEKTLNLPRECKNEVLSAINKSWTAAAQTIHNVIEDHWSPAPTFSASLPLVYISIRPDDFLKSINSFIEHNVHIEKLVVLTNHLHVTDFLEILRDRTFDYEVIDEDELLKVASSAIPADHQERNYFLRRELYIQLADRFDVFVACDDDAILISSLPNDEFFRENRYQAYQHYRNLSAWKASPFGTTSFDKGQWQTSEILKNFGYRDGGFAAHRPQIIRTKWAIEIANELQYLSQRNIDEWATYFNIAIHRYPNAIEAKQSTVINWPASFASWMPDWFSDRITFLNHYADVPPDRNIPLSYTSATSEYNLYHFQRLLCDNFTDSITNLYANEDKLTANGNRLYGIRNIWRSVNIEIEGSQEFCYFITHDRNIIVDGRNDIQTIHSRTNLMFKMPSIEGLYEVQIESLDKRLSFSLELVVLPCAITHELN